MNDKILYGVFILIIFLLGIGMKSTIKKEDIFENEINTQLEILEWSKESSEKLDINRAFEEEFKRHGIRKSAINKIIEYRELNGSIESIESLINLKGVGEKTLIQLKDKFYVDSKNIKLKKMNINRVSDDILRTIGFKKKELKKLKKYKSENGKIYSGLDILNVVGEERYNIFKDRFTY